MFTLDQVVVGLGKGLAYKRDFPEFNTHLGTEYLRPVGDGLFRHDVEGWDTKVGSWGGSNELPIETLDNGRWAQNGWELLPEELRQ